MVESIEIRHSSKEKTRQRLWGLLIVVGNETMRLAGGGKMEHLPYLLVAYCTVFLWASWRLDNEFIRADSTGITSRRWFRVHKALWSDIASYSADWGKGSDGSFSSYGWHNLQGKIVLKDKCGHKLLKLKVDFGSISQRSSFRTFIMPRLQCLASSEKIQNDIATVTE